MNPLASNPLRSRADFARAAVQLWPPLKPHFSAGCARVTLSQTGTHFGPVASALEGFSRPLFGLAPLAAGGGDFADWDMFRTGYANGTDPDHPEYWGTPRANDQRLVEAAAISFGLLFAKEQLWDAQTPAAQANIAAGVDYPSNDMTWSQFDEKARAVTSGFGANKLYGTHLHTWRSTVQLPAIQSGERTLVADDYGFLKPWYERALSLQEDGIIRSYGSLKTSQTHYSGPFFNSQIAMLPMGSWFIGTQIDKVASGESTAVNWGIASFPVPDGVAPGATSGRVTSLGINTNSANADAAEDFISWVSGPEGAAVMASVGNIPAMRDDTVLETITSRDGFPQDDTSAGALVTTASYLEMPVHPKAAEYELVLNRVHDALMTENISVDDAIAEMNAGVAAID